MLHLHILFRSAGPLEMPCMSVCDGTNEKALIRGEGQGLRTCYHLPIHFFFQRNRLQDGRAAIHYAAAAQQELYTALQNQMGNAAAKLLDKFQRPPEVGRKNPGMGAPDIRPAD